MCMCVCMYVYVCGVHVSVEGGGWEGGGDIPGLYVLQG